MSVLDLPRAEPQSVERCWTVVLPRPRGAERFLRPETMTAGEQMFFLSAPLAHVVEYEEHLKSARRDLAGRRHARARGTLDLAMDLGVIGPTPPAGRPDGVVQP